VGYWGHLIATGSPRDLLGTPERAEEYGAPVSPPDQVPAQAVAWAEAGHLDHEDDLIRTALTTESTFAEDQFRALLAAFRPSVGDG
jgi:hypothetical protein